ncbi:MAG: hypothetical protein KAY37_04340 [Phycisphaerae bacterium]|nr:hypothetical protein [Phycisphaerae bacterium]
MKRVCILCYLPFLILTAGCPDNVQQINPYLTYAETFGVGGTSEEDAPQGMGGQGAGLAPTFRQLMAVTFQNNHPSAELNVSFVAWVDVSRIRSADQQDALLAGGYMQLVNGVRLGNALVLPMGAFVYDGGGTLGATAIVLGPTQAAPSTGSRGGAEETALQPTSRSITLITPDGILAFVQPPVSSDSVAFSFTQNGEPLTAEPVAGAVGPYAGATLGGGLKTLAQVDVYECDPFRPGLFLQLSGGSAQPNEYFEGDDVLFEFNAQPDVNGDFARVTIGETE